MRTTPTIKGAVARYADALRAMGSTLDAAALESADTWQMAACWLEDSARSASARVQGTMHVGDGHGWSGDEATEGQRVAGGILRARAYQRITAAAPWLIAAMRTINTSVERVAIAEQYAVEAIRLLNAGARDDD